MLEAILSSLTVQAGSALISALLEGRSLNSSDASSLVTSLLKTIIAGQEKAESDFQRLEKKIDARARDPYRNAMGAGRRHLTDATLPHRLPDERQRMLHDARRCFAEAAASVDEGPLLDHAHAEVMQGLTWLALGEPKDVAAAFARAAADLEDEMLVSFALACRDEQGWEQRRNDPLNRLRESILGPSTVLPDFTSSNRFWRSRADHEAVQRFRRSVDGGPGRYPIVSQPDGSAYSVPKAGLLVQVLASSTPIMGLRVELQRDGVTVANERGQSIIAAVAAVERDREGRLSPATGVLDRSTGLRVVRPGELAVLEPPSNGRPMLCVRFGRAEDVDLLAKFHAEIGARPLVGLSLSR